MRPMQCTCGGEIVISGLMRDMSCTSCDFPRPLFPSFMPKPPLYLNETKEQKMVRDAENAMDELRYNRSTIQ